jgi:hypothetical protein
MGGLITINVANEFNIRLQRKTDREIQKALEVVDRWSERRRLSK